jgi:tetratricopeptide (TPR) repeat protein
MIPISVVVMLMSLAAAGGRPWQGAAAPNETLVMPFEDPVNTAKLLWLGEGSAVLLADFLERYGGTAISRDDRVRAFERLQLPPAPVLSHATTIKIGQIVGAAEIVVGSYQFAGDQLTVRVRSIRLGPGSMTPEVVERGPLSDLFGIYDRAARRLRGVTAIAPPPPPGTVLASHNAFELYVKGLIAAAPTAQQTFLQQAAKAAPSDDRVKLALWQVHTDSGDYQQALTAAAGVSSSSLHSRAARYLVARSQLDLKRYDDAFNTLRALQAEARSAEVLNAMGVVQLRRGGTPQSGRATYYFSQASQVDPSDADYFFNLGYAYVIDRDPPAAVYWLREAVRRQPADGDAHLVLAAALQQTGAATEAARERELAERLTSTEARAASDGVPRDLERLKDYRERAAPRVDAAIATADQRDQNELAAFHLGSARRAFDRDSDREAEQDLRRALYLSPYLADAHLLLGRILLRNGRSAEAIQAFKIALWSEESVRGHLALAEAYLAVQNQAAARDEIDRALKLDPASAEARSLRAKISP